MELLREAEVVVTEVPGHAELVCTLLGDEVFRGEDGPLIVDGGSVAAGSVAVSVAESAESLLESTFAQADAASSAATATAIANVSREEVGIDLSY